MADFYHAIVWIDHHEARIASFDERAKDECAIRARDSASHIHHRANTIGAGHIPKDKDFFARVVSAIGGAKAILVTGPSNAKNELIEYIGQHAPLLSSHIAGVKTLDHPTDNELVALARAYFRADHQVLPRSL